jgi:oxaloacetate decarboxylase alpha subunit/pyruvate carboxylase subunit B
MAGLLTPRVTYNLVKAIKQRHSAPIVVHSHDTAGLALASYIAAIDAGADAVETSITPFANGTGQPDTVRMLAALAENPRIPHYDAKVLFELRQYFEGVAKELAAFMSPANDRVDSDALTFQVPGGMLSNFRNQLKEMKMESKFADVMAEVPVVREALGWIPLVTPTSQIVGTQAMLNVKFGRWQNLAQATIDVALGKYGRPPGGINADLLALARKKSGQEPVEGRPADLLAPRLPALKEELVKKGIEPSDDNAVLYAMFPRETDALYNKKPAVPAPAPKPVVLTSPTPAAGAHLIRRFFITINNRRSEVLVEELS